MQRRSRRQAGRDAGFTFVELLVTLLICSVVLMSLGGVFLSGVKSITLAKQRQAASALANRVMEQVRALPYDALRAGLVNNGTLTADPNIVSTAGGLRFRPSYDSAIDEPLITNTGSSGPAPLYPHTSSTSINNVTYTVKTYVTLAAPTPARYWITTVVSWTSRVTGPGGKVTAARTQAFSPAGCLSTAQHPYSGPCQASLYATGGITPGAISVRPLTSAVPILEGVDARLLEIGLPQLSTTSVVEQTVGVRGKTTTTQIKLVDGAGETLRGAATTTTSSDNDPSTGSGGGVDGKTTGTPSTGTLTADGTSATISVSTSASDVGTERSGITASGTPACEDMAGATVPGDQPCGSGRLTGSGTSTTTLDLKTLGTTNLSAMVLGSHTQSSNVSRAMSARFTTSGSASLCPTPAGDGCAASAVDRRLGTIELGGIPAEAPATKPLGYTSGPLVTITGLREQVGSSSGSGATPPTPVTAGTLTYWNGTGFTPLDLATVTTAQDLPAYGFTATWADGVGGVIAVDITSRISLRPPVTTSTGSAPCRTEACVRTVTSNGVVSAVLEYRVTHNALPVASFQVQAQLGGPLVKTSYKAAPNA